MRSNHQRVMHCPCARLPLGLCLTCYTLKRQDEKYFGGLLNEVLERDEDRCRVCGTPGRRTRSIVVQHRPAGRSLLHLMISLCPSCRAKASRTQLVLTEVTPLLLVLCREQHPDSQEQIRLDSKTIDAFPKEVSLFEEMEEPS